MAKVQSMMQYVTPLSDIESAYSPTMARLPYSLHWVLSRPLKHPSCIPNPVQPTAAEQQYPSIKPFSLTRCKLLEMLVASKLQTMYWFPTHCKPPVGFTLVQSGMWSCTQVS